MQGAGFRVQGAGLTCTEHGSVGHAAASTEKECPARSDAFCVRVSGFGLRVSGFGFRFSVFGFRG